MRENGWSKSFVRSLWASVFFAQAVLLVLPTRAQMFSPSLPRGPYPGLQQRYNPMMAQGANSYGLNTGYLRFNPASSSLMSPYLYNQSMPYYSSALLRSDMFYPGSSAGWMSPMGIYSNPPYNLYGYLSQEDFDDQYDDADYDEDDEEEKEERDSWEEYKRKRGIKARATEGRYCEACQSTTTPEPPEDLKSIGDYAKGRRQESNTVNSDLSGATCSPENGRGEWDHKWSDAVEDAFDDDFLKLPPPEDLSKICRGYEKASIELKRGFWVQVIQLISEFESNHYARARYCGVPEEGLEAPPQIANGGAIGLTQIGTMDFGYYKSFGCCSDSSCNNDKPNDELIDALRDPEVNVRCASAILKKRFTINRDFLVYWDLLRAHSPRAKRGDIGRPNFKRELAIHPACS